MIIIDNFRDGKEITDMATMLALQVYVLNNLDLEDDVVFPYRPTPTIQIGKYQNTIEEINQDYVEANNVQVVRRDTGGGAIYMDMNQMNFVFLLNHDGSKLEDNFKRIYAPTIKALESLGAKNVALSGRNDLEIDGQKISGAALTITNGKLYGGYSLLIDVDLDSMEKALKPSRKKIESKGIKSVRARVKGFRDQLGEEYQDISILEFKEQMLKYITETEDPADFKYYTFTDEDWAAIDKMVEEKYGNWDWNYGKSPRYEYNREGRFAAGTVKVSLSVTKGSIESIHISGDFFGTADIDVIEEALVGTRMVREDLLQALEPFEMSAYFGKLTKEELVDLILE